MCSWKKNREKRSSQFADFLEQEYIPHIVGLLCKSPVPDFSEGKKAFSAPFFFSYVNWKFAFIASRFSTFQAYFLYL